LELLESPFVFNLEDLFQSLLGIVLAMLENCTVVRV
jgi:hypothetical protein